MEWMAEFELSVLSRQALKRFDNKDELVQQIQTWQTKRNKSIVKANWHFTKEDARIKLRKLYPTTLNC